MNGVAKVRPSPRGFTHPYLSLDQQLLRNGIENLVSESGAYFNKPLDSSRIVFFTADGTTPHEPPISEVASFIDLIDESTVRVDIHLEVSMTTPRGMFKIIVPDEYVDISIDFKNRTFGLRISALDLSNVERIGALLMDGVTLITARLPDEHRYLQPLIQRFLKDNPDPSRNVFLIIRFKDEAPFPQIDEAIKAACAEKGLRLLRADKEYTDSLLDNVLTYLYGCDYAIAVFDQINFREFNPNVAFEVGFCFAQCTRVLLLKDQAIPVMPADIVGKIYKPFNTYDPLTTIPRQVKKWLDDYEIGERAAALNP